MTIPQMLNSAAEHHRAGRLAQAEHLYRAILAEQPYHADALHLLGVLANQTGHHKDACDWINKAIAQRPVAEYYFNLAGALNPLGEAELAIDALRHAIALKPGWAAPHANLGTILQISGRADESVACFQKAIALEPRNALFYYNLGNALVISEKYPQATEAFETSLRLHPNNAEALNNLGNILHAQGRFDEAEQRVRHALKINPAFFEALNNLGNILISLNRFEKAAEVFRQAIAINPRMPMVYNNLANVLCGLGRHKEAIDIYHQALALNPTWPEIYNNLSIALRFDGNLDSAISAAEQSIRQRPGYYLARENLGLALHEKGDLDRAIEIFTQLISDCPHDGRIRNSYGNALRSDGQLEQAIANYRAAAEADPLSFLPASNYLFALQFHTDDAAFLLAEHRKWDQRYATPLKSEIQPLKNGRHPHRRLRVGYVSPDFRIHCQSLFTNSLLPHHDHERFEIFCYSMVLRPDAVTARLQQHSDVWREITLLSEQAMAEVIRDDQIDILVDLTMHMGHCHPLLYARKPAPIQVAWLAYPGTTGLSTMDYRLTDPYLDPPGFDSRYSEQSVRLPDTFWCYDPDGMAENAADTLPDPGELPALKNGFVTFGCLNDFSKVSAGTLQRWGRLMQSVPGSRLHLLAPRGGCRERVLQQLQSLHIGPERIEFIERQIRSAYMAEYRRIDLCLDTLPYNGHTTSLDAFWMGVPVLTQVGSTVVGRAGLSQLTNLQLPGFIADTDEQFFQLGCRWAGDLSALAEIRRTLRDRMAASPLMDKKKFTRSMEAAFQRMWQHWIAQ